MSDHLTCKGFTAGGVAAGIKKKAVLDLGLIASESPAAVAGLFTTNRVKAAPVMLDLERIRSCTCRAVIVNSGNANCCTGEDGLVHAKQMARYAADALGVSEGHVLVASTGVIGKPLPIEKIQASVPDLAASLKPDGWGDFVRAIMTTDTIPKLHEIKGTIDGRHFSLIGAAKGVGMIHPEMATMLAFLCTDARIASSDLHNALVSAAAFSFNRITVDGDTSTNDTALILANGASGVVIDTPESLNYFQGLLNDMCLRLARMLVKDGEGAGKLVDIVVKGAVSDRDALAVAKTIAGSNLVKTAFFGEDANWGRIICAVGRSGVEIDANRIDIYFDNVMMVKNSAGCGDEAETQATEVLKKPEFRVTVDLNLGHGSDRMITCDFSIDYVKINADYRS
ncbi:MAG: bifunctional glutamate N-acetyltransferase/amino-acid acetyltransferase ArgJ [Desulfobacterales bacterium]